MATSANDNPFGVNPGTRSPTRTALSGGGGKGKGRKSKRGKRKSGRY